VVVALSTAAISKEVRTLIVLTKLTCPWVSIGTDVCEDHGYALKWLGFTVDGQSKARQIISEYKDEALQDTYAPPSLSLSLSSVLFLTGPQLRTLVVAEARVVVRESLNFQVQ